MKNTELRLGNFVYDIAKCESKILEIKTKSVLLLTDDLEEFSNDISDLQGIGLTLEWLIKLGFEGSSIIVNEYSLGWFTVQLNGAVKFRCNDGCLDKKIFKYVHELQNFYFAVTGNELECVGF